MHPVATNHGIGSITPDSLVNSQLGQTLGAPQSGDLLIRDVSPHGKFIIVDALTHAAVAGPLDSLRRAAQAGRALRPDAMIWKENHDERGRTFGAPFRLPL